MNFLWLQIAALQSLLLAVSGRCGKGQYTHSINRVDTCCNACAAGQKIDKPCTSPNSASTCRDCEEGYFNPQYYRAGCIKCKICDIADGSIEVEPCTKGADAKCACPNGSEPRNERNTACLCHPGKEIVNNKCQPCANGYFSIKENSKCLPWTNCSAIGLTVLEAGSATKDVQCSPPKSTTSWVQPTSVASSPSPPGRTQSKDETSTKASTVKFTIQVASSNAINWDTVSLILIFVTLLMVSAGIILGVIIHTKKKKRNKGFIRSNRCKVPVQEESTDSESSLAKSNAV